MTKKNAVPAVPERERLLLCLQTSLKAAHVAAESLKIEQGPSVTAKLKTVIGSIAYIRTLVA